MLMRYFGLLNNMLQQYDDLLLTNRQNTKSICIVYCSSICGCMSFTYADNLNYAAQMLVIVDIFVKNGLF